MAALPAAAFGRALLLAEDEAPMGLALRDVAMLGCAIMAQRMHSRALLWTLTTLWLLEFMCATADAAFDRFLPPNPVHRATWVSIQQRLVRKQTERLADALIAKCTTH